MLFGVPPPWLAEHVLGGVPTRGVSCSDQPLPPLGTVMGPIQLLVPSFVPLVVTNPVSAGVGLGADHDGPDLAAVGTSGFSC